MKSWLAVCGVVMSAGAWADDLGRLFTTPEQRARHERPAPAPAQAPAATGRALVQRRGGAPLVISADRPLGAEPPASVPAASTGEGHR